MAMTGADYLQQLQALLPPGPAWSSDFASYTADILEVFGNALGGADYRAEDLQRELDPRTTRELISRWEWVLGLPDKCSGTLEATLQGRRGALVAKLVSGGGQSIAYFTEVAARLGYEVTIKEFRPFRAGRSCAGNSLTNGDWVFTWRVIAPEVTVTHFRAGLSSAGEPLRAWGNDTLECKLNQLKPAHTLLQFAYVPLPIVINEFAFNLGA